MAGIITQLWKYQWTNTFTELTDELNSKLHELSVGNLDMASRTFREAQRALIGSPDERITVASLEMGYTIACGLSSQTQEIISLKEGMLLPCGQPRKTRSKDTSSSGRVDSTGDITKPQHPEFASRIIELLGAVDLVSRIKDPDIFQRAGKSDNPLQFLTLNSLMLGDPLTELNRD